MMTELDIAHANLVYELAKKGRLIQEELTPQKADLLHMVIGIAGEVGELLDAVKKHVIYNLPLDNENIVEELGDLEFYLMGLRQNLAISREETLEGNIKKLRKRYPKGWTQKAARDRADKK